MQGGEGTWERTQVIPCPSRLACSAQMPLMEMFCSFLHFLTHWLRCPLPPLKSSAFSALGHLPQTVTPEQEVSSISDLLRGDEVLCPTERCYLTATISLCQMLLMALVQIKSQGGTMEHHRDKPLVYLHLWYGSFPTQTFHSRSLTTQTLSHYLREWEIGLYFNFPYQRIPWLHLQSLHRLASHYTFSLSW